MSHIHEKIDFVATVFVVHNNKVLLRKHEKYHIWLGVGGHIELDEDPNQAIIREAKEESGLDITILDPPHTKIPLKDYDSFDSLIAPAYLNIHKITDTHQHIDLVYFATSSEDRLIPEDESMVLKWFTKEELLEKEYNLPESIIFYCTKALEMANN